MTDEKLNLYKTGFVVTFIGMIMLAIGGTLVGGVRGLGEVIILDGMIVLAFGIVGLIAISEKK